MTNADVLVVDDCPADLELARHAASGSERVRTVHLAANGVEALQVMHQLATFGAVPALILLDLHMPSMDGFEFLDAMEEDWSSEVVIMTGSSSDPLRLRALNYTQVLEYIEKPILTNDIVRLMRRLRHVDAAE